jgi:hypothetical protein
MLYRFDTLLIKIEQATGEIMSINPVQLGIVIVSTLVTLYLSYLSYKRVRGAGYEKIRNARREVIAILSNHLAHSKTELQTSALENIFSCKYRDLHVKSVNTTEFPIIIEELTTQIAQDIFLSEEKKRSLIERVTLLRNRFEKRELGLQQAVENWEESSIFKIGFKIVNTLVLSLGAGLTIIILSIVSNIGIVDNLTQLVTLLVVIAGFPSFMQYRLLREERKRSGLYLHNALEDTVASAVRHEVPDASFERSALTTDGKIAEVDILMTINEEKVPVEIKHGKVSPTTINQLANTMRMLKSNKAILATSSQAGNKVRELAKSNNIIILDSVVTEDDILKRLRNTRFGSGGGGSGSAGG